jgi:hypothetical protein
MAARAKRSLDPSYLVAVAASRDEKLRQAVLANKDVQRVLPLNPGRVPHQEFREPVDLGLGQREMDGEIPSSRGPKESRVGVARTISIVTGGSAPIPESFMERFGRVIVAGGKGLLLTQDLILDRFPNRALDDPAVSCGQGRRRRSPLGSSTGHQGRSG